jgi:hypothetical protein
MKKIVLGGVLALFVTAGAVYAYRTVRATIAHGDGTIVFTCPLTGEPMCHGKCPAAAKAEKAEHPDCCKKTTEPNP